MVNANMPPARVETNKETNDTPVSSDWEDLSKEEFSPRKSPDEKPPKPTVEIVDAEDGDVYTYKLPGHATLDEKALSKDVNTEQLKELSTKDRARLSGWQGVIKQMHEVKVAQDEPTEVESDAESNTKPDINERLEPNITQAPHPDKHPAPRQPEHFTTDKKESSKETKKKPIRPEDLGMTAKELLEAQPGLMIIQDIENGNSKFWMHSPDKDGEPYETTLNRELEKYRDQITKAKDITELSRATRIRESVRFALGDNDAIMKKFDEIEASAGLEEKREQFSGDPTKFEKGRLDIAIKDMKKQVLAAEKDLAEIENSLKNYKGFKGLFGKNRAMKSQLKWQKEQSENRLAHLRDSLVELERRFENLKDT